MIYIIIIIIILILIKKNNKKMNQSLHLKSIISINDLTKKELKLILKVANVFKKKIISNY